jgi:FtsH-binding integral membrane protein
VGLSFTFFFFFSAFGLVQGLVIGPLVEAVLDIDPALVVTALGMSVAVFVSFSLFAIYSERRSLLYLGGMLSSALSMLCLMGLFSLFFPSQNLFNIRLYGGLLGIFILFIYFVRCQKLFHDETLSQF